jgi:leader peptidase (prepilin peptidase)/N-methyltransferase
MLIAWPLAGFAVAVLINLIADRWPHDLPLSGPRCAACDTPRRGARWLALGAFIVRRRACPHCGRLIGWRPLIVELALPALFAYLAVQFPDPLTLLIASFHTAVLALVCVIDFETRLILHRVIVPAIIAAAVLAFATPNLKPLSAFVGGAVGLLITGAIYLGGIAYVRVQARRGIAIDEVAFGFGDVTLMLYVGLMTGLFGVLRVLVLGVLFGGIAAGAIFLAGAVRRQSALNIPFAYGPYLALAGWITLIQILGG